MDIRLVNLSALDLFGKYKRKTSSAKHLEEFSHAHFVSLIWKLITSARDTDVLSIGFDWDRFRRQRESTNKKIREEEVM